MQPEEYIRQRVDDQIAWYDGKSQLAQRLYKLLRVLEICLAASVPVLSGFSEAVHGAMLIVALSGVALTVVAGLLSLYRYQEIWVSYRGVCESLRREKFLFLTRVAPYDKESPFQLFVERAEAIMSQENNTWTSYTRTASATERELPGAGGPSNV